MSGRHQKANQDNLRDQNKINVYLPMLGLFLYILTGVVLYYHGFSQFKSLPSPIYGGDFYFQMGSIWHIRLGGNPLESSAILNTVPGYLPLYAFLCAKFCNLFQLSTIEGMLYFSILIYVISSLIWFFVLQKIFKSCWLALVGTIIINAINKYPIIKYTPFTSQIMLPLFLLFLYLVFTEKKIIYFVGLGVVYGLLTLSHMVAFIGGTIIIITIVVYEIVYNKNKLKNYLKENWIKWIVFIVVCLPIIMLYWYKPIFKYHLHMAYDRIHMDISDFSQFRIQIKFLFNVIKRYLFNFNSIYNGVLTVLLWFGLYRLFFSKKNEHINLFFKLVSLGTLVAVFSYFLTEPILKMNFIPNYMESFYLNLIATLLSIYGFRYLLFSFNLKRSYMIGVMSIACILLTVQASLSFNRYLAKDKWAQVAKHSISDHYKALQKYILTHTQLNDVILTTKELGFALYSLTGRKLVTCRWAQLNNPYIFIHKRDMDAAVILYGNDSGKKRELLQKYKVSYVYWDYYWINSEYNFDQKGKLRGIYDPLLTYDTLSNRNYLSRFGVKYFPLFFWIDPSCRNRDVRKYKLLFVSPQNYYSFIHPWKPDLDKFLTEVWSYTRNGKKISILYKVKLKE